MSALDESHYGDVPGPDDLRRVVRAAKGASAALSAMADATREVGVEIAALRARVQLGDDAPPKSWEVERHSFVTRLLSRGDADAR